MRRKKKMYFKFCLLFIFCTLYSYNIFSQATIKPFQIKTSELFKKLSEHKANNPKITTKEIVEKANELLYENGLNFSFTFDTATCKKIDSFYENDNNKNKPILLRATLQSVGGEKASVILPEPIADNSPCGICSVKVPVLEIKDDKFIIKIRDKIIKFVLPKNFSLHTLNLFENGINQPFSKSWTIPSNLNPVSISPDSSIVYFEISEPEFNDLALAIYQNGAFQFFVKDELILLDNKEPLESKDSKYSYLSFGEDDSKKVLGYKSPCNYTL